MSLGDGFSCLPRVCGKRSKAGLSVLKTIGPMPIQKHRMRSKRKAVWRNRLSGGIDDGINAGTIIDLPRDENFEFVRKADQSAIKHPVGRATQGDTIPHAIGATHFHGLDMRGLCFSSSPTVNKLPSGDCAALIVRLKDSAAEKMLCAQPWQLGVQLSGAQRDMGRAIHGPAMSWLRHLREA